MTRHTCPRCGAATAQRWCCGIDLAARAPWRMTRERIRHVHALAYGRKGLDEDTYRLRLRAVGVGSSLELDRAQFERLVQGLLRLPDAPDWTAKQRAKPRRAA